MKQEDLFQFLDAWFSEISRLGIDIKNLPLDHIGYSVSSSKGYDFTKEQLLKESKFIREHIISGRRVAVFEFFEPHKYKNYTINAIEIVEPVEGEINKTGFEHAEFTTQDSFEQIVTRYPDLHWDVRNINRPDFPRLKLVMGDGIELKFNHTPILIN